jgi:hypothetical protein
MQEKLLQHDEAKEQYFRERTQVDDIIDKIMMEDR